jgi:glycosyltransferase involved in cell wall biosynthesis
MPEPPLVTVLMSVFNDSAYLAEAVTSILNQTFTNFEFLILDDGSTDGSSEFVGGLRDPRVRVVRHETNQGLTRSLKEGVDLAAGRYVARMDADDVACADRLGRQVSFLEEHPDVALLGGACVQIDEAGRCLRLQRQPETDLEIRWTSLLVNPFLHSTVMLRRPALRAHALNYDEAFQTTQDYDLWSRLLPHGRGANLPMPLIGYRVRAGVTARRRAQQLAHAVSIAHRTIRRDLPDFRITLEQVRVLFYGVFQAAGPEGARLPDWAPQIALYRRLLEAFGAKHRGHPDWPRVRRSFEVSVLWSAWGRRFPTGWLRPTAGVVARDPRAAVRLLRERLRARRELQRFSTATPDRPGVA